MATTDQIRSKIQKCFGITINDKGYIQTIDKNNQIKETTDINLIEVIHTALQGSNEHMKDDIEDYLEILLNTCLTAIDTKNIKS